MPPPPWGLLGATWRLVPSHQLIGALDPPTVTSVSAPNTRSQIFVHGGGPEVHPVLGQVSPAGAGPRGFGFGSVHGGVPVGSTGGALRGPWLPPSFESKKIASDSEVKRYPS